MKNVARLKSQGAVPARCFRHILTRLLAVVTAIFLVSALIPSTSSAQTASPPTAPTSLIIKLAAGLLPDEQAAVIAQNGGIETSAVPALRLHVVEVSADELDQVIVRYGADPRVVRVEFNKVRQSNAIPSDPFYSQQWALPKIGWDLVFGNSMPGGSVIVAVLDTGIEASHPDLGSNIIPGTSLLDGSNGLTDPSGHGTMVAGTIAARTNTAPAEGIAGVAYAGVRLMPVTVLDADGLGQDGDIIAGVMWAVDHGANVIVMAFSNPGFSDSLQDAIDYAWSNNVVLVAAAGNDALGTPTYPAGDRGVIGVSATDANDQLASFSNYGPSVFLAAPGTDILTTDVGNSYLAINGTSSAAAIVAGAAAQLMAIDPTRSNGVIVGRLARTADPAGTQDQTGNGRINLARALADTGIDFVQPAGAMPIGAGGPFVGPYRAAAIGTTTTIASNNNPSNFGQPVTFTATVTCSSTCTFAPGSTVDFKDGANNGCNGGTTLASVSSLTGSGLTRQATFSTSSLAAGAHSLRACFNNGGSGSNPNAGASVSLPLSQVVNGAAATTLNVSAASGTYGGTTTLSATLTSGGTGVSGKTIGFTLNGGPAGSATTNASGIATLSNVSLSTTLNAATYPTGVGASFAGDSNFLPSSGTAQLTVSQASSLTKVTCPSTSSTYSGAAQTPCTASVTGAGGLNLTPTPTYSNNTNAGTATASYTYAGDGNYIGSTDSNTFTITKANTATAVTSSVNPSNAGSSVTFTAGVTSAAGTVQGTVQFVVDGTDSGAPVALVNGQATWATSALTTAKTYAVSANYISDTNFNSSSGSLTGGQIVVAGPLDHLIISPASATITTGGSQSYTAEGFDAYGNSRGDVTAATAFSITDGSCTAATCTATVAGDQTVTGDDAGKTGTATLTVVPGALKTFLVEAVGGGSIQPQTAGTPFSVRITARDQFNNAVTSFGGTVSLTSSGVLVGTPVTSGPFVNGVLASQSVTITSAQSGTTLTAIGGGGNGTSNGFTVNPAGIHSFLVESAGGGTIGAQTAGAPFNIWITARDQFNNTVVNFVGGVTLSSNANLTTPVSAAFTGTEDGILEVNGVVLTQAGQNKEITVTDGANSGTSNDFTVNPGGVANFLIEKAGGGEIAPQTAHTPFDIWITARDAFNNTVINFTGTVALSTDAGAITPATEDFVSSDSGIHQASVTVTQAGTNKHISASADADTGSSNPFTVNKASATVTLDAATLTQTYEGTGRIVTATTDPAGLTVHITYDGSSTPPINVGTYAVVATIDDEGYEGSASGTLTVSKRPITITADSKTKVYGDPEPTLTYHITTGSLVAGDVFTGALTRVAGENVGTYAIQQGTLALTNNYVLTYVGANLSITGRPITVTADAKTKVYGDTEPALTYHVTTGSLVTGDNFTGALTRVAGENVGSYAIQQGTLALSANYVLTYVGANFSITARPITVTADAKTKGYGDAEPALTYHITTGSLVTGDSFTGTLTRVTGENVGTYAIEQGTLALSANYLLTYVGANLSITARPITVTADAKTKGYGDAEPALTYHITTGSLVTGDTFTGALTRVAGENVGSYAIQQGTLALTNNYVLTYVGANLTITARPITVTADAKSKGYGDPEPALAYHITTGSLVTGDSFTGALTRIAGENVGTYAIQQGTLALTNNYVLTYIGANLTITTRPITITADTKSKVYGYGDPALTYHITAGSLVGSDSFSGAPTRVAGENVGTYAIQQGTLALSANYVLTYVGANLSITARPITVTVDAKTKVYGNTDPSFTYQIGSGSLVPGDNFSGALTRVAGENVGTYSILQGTLGVGTNYMLTYVGANLAITPRALTVSADNKTKIAGGANPTLTGMIVGLQFNDNISASFSTTAVTLSMPGDYPITPTLIDPTNKLGNYAMTSLSGMLKVTPNAFPVLGTITAPVVPLALGTSIQISVPFTDADVAESKPYTATIDWGDGSTSSSSFSDVGTITGSKTYAVSGIYVVSVTIRQDNFQDHFDAKTVEGYVVVYDAKNGFVTGGGWINSPAGAYTANPSLTGKANFGFVSKYQNGATQPTGNTEFQFNAGNFNFKSTLYDWLVISGGFKAQYKGSGTVNGQPGYSFMLTAIDGGAKGGGAPDTFRLKVWNAGGTVYDNQLNAPDTNDPTTQVSGGSIVIHK